MARIPLSRNSRTWMFNLLMLFLCLPLIANAQLNSWNINLVSESRVTGWYRDVVVVDTIAYFSNSYGLVLFDASDPSELELIKRIPTSGSAKRMIVNDTLLYLTDYYDGFRIYSISDAINPREIGHISLPGYVENFDIDGNRAYLVVNGTICIVDIEDPTGPQFISQYRHEIHGAISVAAYDNFFYYTYLRAEYLGICDANDPENPEYIESYRLEGETNDVSCMRIHNGFLFVCNASTLFIFSLDNPRSPQLLSSTNCNGSDISFFGDFAYFSGKNIQIFDVSNPENPIRLTHFIRRWDEEPYHKGTGNYYHDGHLLIADGLGQVRVYDVSNPESIELTFEHYNPILTRNVAVNGNYAYVDDASTYPDWLIESYSIENPADPSFLFSVEPIADDYYGFEIFENRLYITHGGICGFRVLSLDNPEQPELINTASVDGHQYIYDFIRYHDYIYGSSYQRGVMIFSLADPDSPRFIREVEYYTEGFRQGWGWDIAIANDHLYNSSTRFGLIIYDLENPENPEFISATTFNETPHHIAAYEDFVYGSNSSGLQIYSVEDPRNPELIDVRPGEADYSANLYIDNNVLYVCNLGFGVHLYSLENPSDPEKVGFYDTPSIAVRLKIRDNYIYVADSYDFSILDASHALGVWFISTSEEFINFGEVELNGFGTHELTISNLSEVDREIERVTIDNDAFTTDFERRFTLESGADTTLNVFFAPARDTVYSGSLVITSDAKELTITLAGIGAGNGVDEEILQPYEFGISSIQPNPFNSICVINYQIDKPSHITLTTFDLTGRKVAELVNDQHQPGSYKAVWNAGDKATGVYFVRLSSGGEVFTRKLVLVR